MNNSRKTFSLIQEPEGRLYHSLIDTALVHCSTALLVIRDANDLGMNAKRVLERLRPFLVEEKLVSDWPGTTLYGHFATVSKYTMSMPCASILIDATENLFGWQHPDLPEDLCLLRTDGSPWLVTIAHESDGYFELNDSEHEDLIGRIPEMGGLLRVG